MTDEDELSIRSSLEAIKDQSWRLLSPLDWFPVACDRLQSLNLSASLYNITKSQVQSGLTFYGVAYQTRPGEDLELGFQYEFPMFRCRVPVFSLHWRSRAWRNNAVGPIEHRAKPCRDYACSIFNGYNWSMKIESICKDQFRYCVPLDGGLNSFGDVLDFFLTEARIENAHSIKSPWDARSNGGFI